MFRRNHALAIAGTLTLLALPSALAAQTSAEDAQASAAAAK